MILGLVLLFFELSQPGVGLAGILGGLFIITAFISFHFLPIRIGGMVLLITGIILLLAEPFVASNGIFAVGGLVALILGFLWMIDPSFTNIQMSPAVWVPAVAFLGSMVALIIYTTSRTKTLTQKLFAQMGGGELAGLYGYPAHVTSISPNGKSGKVLIRGEIWNMESDSSVQIGQTVKLVEIHGMTLKVKPL
jgi:membrane-bound serine protease (ClpP class)